MFKLKSSEGHLRCCIIISNEFIFNDFCNKRLIIYDEFGHYNRDIKLSGPSGSISVINAECIAASFSQEYIEIIKIRTGEVQKRIATRGVNSGISFQCELLYVLIDMKKIDVLSLPGNLVRSFRCPSSDIQYISTNADRLFLTKPKFNIIYCCDLYGSVIWKFTNKQMSYPWGITTDLNANVYVTCRKSNSVKFVTHDGQNHGELLTEKDGLIHPTGICFDKSKNRLLLCNNDSHAAFLYDIKLSTKRE